MVVLEKGEGLPGWHIGGWCGWQTRQSLVEEMEVYNSTPWALLRGIGRSYWVSVPELEKGLPSEAARKRSFCCLLVLAVGVAADGALHILGCCVWCACGLIEGKHLKANMPLSSSSGKKTQMTSSGAPVEDRMVECKNLAGCGGGIGSGGALRL